MKNLYKKIAAIGGLSVAGVLAGAYITAPQEGLKLYPYYDSVGVLTVCRGHTGDDIELRNYTEEECSKIYVKDLAVAEKAVDQALKVQVDDYTKAALIDFTFHKGGNAFKKSSLVKKINEGHGRAACAELARWTFARGRDCKIRSNNCYGVAKRALLEQDWCLGKYRVVDGQVVN